MTAFTAPYETLAWLATPIAVLALGYLSICLATVLRAAFRNPAELRNAALVAAALLFLAAQWLFAASHQIALAGLVLCSAGLLALRPSGGPRIAPAPMWAGLAVIALATGLKCIALEEWPAALNEYSAETGWRGIRTLEGYWPADFWRGKEYDLVNGGVSPLHLPVSWVTVRLFGGTVYALRFAEVLSSTVLLLVFWAWLRMRLDGLWAVVSFAVFALSPWHLAQSRMGTFYSASVAVGLSLLWLAEHLWASASSRLRTWVGFGACAGLIGYAYAPLKVLYAFFLVVTAAVAWRDRRAGRRGWWRGPLMGVVVCAAFVALQLGSLARFEEMFRRDFGPLATDTSVWHKTAEDEVTAAVQPLSVVVSNVARNLSTWWDWTWSDPGVLIWYAPALTAAVPAAAVLLFRARSWVPALYFLIGTLPPLVIFPVLRRTLVLWPLVYAAGVVAAREVARICARQVDHPWWRGATWVLYWLGLALATLHGLHVYASTNSIVGLRQYFGPDHQLEMFVEAERMLPSCRVYFVNATFEEKMVASVRLFEPSRRLGDRDRFGFVELPAGGEPPDLPRDQPLCFFDLNRPDDADSAGEGAQALAEHFPGGFALRRWAADGSDTLLYTVLMLGGGEDEGEESE